MSLLLALLGYGWVIWAFEATILSVRLAYRRRTLSTILGSLAGVWVMLMFLHGAILHTLR